MTGGILHLLRRAAEALTVAMVAVLFLSVVYQVFTRYVLGAPVNWTIEVASIAWLWIIFWAGSLLVRHDDQIRIDILYLASGRRTKMVLAGLSAVVTLIAFVLAFGPVVEFVQFMKIDYSPLLRIGYDQIFSIFLLFMVCAILRAILALVSIARGRLPEEPRT